MKLHKDTIFCTIVMVVALAVAGFLGFLADNLNAEEPQPVPEWSAVELLHEQNGTLTEWQMLLMAISFTESKWNAQAVGKAGDSGHLQLMPVYIAEVNRLYGTNYTIRDAFNIKTSIEIYEKMQAHYNPERDIEKAILLHNKSPYYRKEVLRNMELIRNMESVRKEVVK